MTETLHAKLRRPWAGLAAAGLLAGLTALVLPTGPAVAQEDEQQEETQRTGAMSERVYRKLAEAQELADEENFAGALVALDEIKSSGKLSPYEQAQLYNFYGYIYFAQERYQDSIRAYETVLATPEIPPGLRQQTIYTLAQLHFTTESWQKSIDLLTQWVQGAPNPSPDPFVIICSAYYQLEQYSKMIQPCERAIAIARERGEPVKEQWWLLLRVGYFEQENFKKVRDILETLVVNWPKKEYWTQLSAMYGELDQSKRQLSAYAAAYEQGLLTQSSELVTLAQLYLQAEAPYPAAKILDKGLEAGQIEKTADNYRLLSQAWALAAEDRKAIPALKTAANMSDEGELNVRLAQSYLNLSEYSDCIESARTGLRKGGVRRDDTANVILGMCLFETDQYDQAKTAFRKAAQDKRSAATARQWLSFIESEQERLRQLERSLAQLRRESAAREASPQ